MNRLKIFDTIETLRREGQPFAVATVVRSADVTSAKAGAKAVCTSSGSILGHLGGGCVQRAVKTSAAECLLSGQTRMIRVKPTDDAEPIEDIEIHNSGCPSGGTVDILIEPYKLPPQVIIFGDTPVGRAIEQHANLAEFRVAVLAAEDLAGRQLQADDFLIVASQGSGDLRSLHAALETPVAHISLIASRKKADALKMKLFDGGATDFDFDRVKAPAGLDIGGIDPHEIAVSVLAEIIQWRRMN